MFYNFKKGFSLVELLVVVSIVAVLSTGIAIGYNNFVTKAKISKVQNDLRQINGAIVRLLADTGLRPNHLPATPCVGDPEIFLDQTGAGIVATDGGYPNWDGPYISGLPKDPWGRQYQFDPDFICYRDDPDIGCENVNFSGLSKTVAVVQSLGPDGSQGNNYDSPDDIVRVLCE